jgi:Co/Zn/Cd efflux system component
LAGCEAVDRLIDPQAVEHLGALAVGSIALLASVPLTTGLAALAAARVPASALPAHGHHAH